MKTLLVAAILWLCSAAAFASPFERLEGIGKDRENLTPQMIHIKSQALQKASEFWLLRMPDAKDAPARIFDPQIWNIIENSGRKYGVDPYYIAAIGFVESYGRADAVSPTGPRGWGQFSEKSAKDIGLVIKKVRHKVVSTRLVWKGKGKKRRRVKRTQVNWISETVRDDRFDPEKAIPAIAKRLSQSLKTFGRMDFALQEYHNGTGRVRRMVSLYLGLNPKNVKDRNVAELISKNNLTYPQVYFDNTPYHKPELYAYFIVIKEKADFAPTYSFRIDEAASLLRLYKDSSSQYAAKFESYRNRFKPDGIAASRMWTFFTPERVEQLQFADLVALQNATDIGRLVKLPEPWADYGYQPRLHGTSPIAEKDPLNRGAYIQAEAGTVGCLIYIMNELKLLQGGKFIPYEVNSLVRTASYQDALRVTNGNARTLLPTHTMGKAFDLPLRGMSFARKRDLLFILADMDSHGMISYIPEGSQETIHVVPHPVFETFFERVHRQAIGNRLASSETN